jgi:hypothetical protein
MLRAAQFSCSNELIIYLMRSTISATIATATHSAILAKKTPPTPIWQRYCIWRFVSNQNPALFSIFTALFNIVFMSFSQKQNIIFYFALTLSVFQLIQYLVSGGIFLTLLAGLVPFWLWSTRKKLLANVEIGSFDQVLSYVVVVYAAFAGLIAVLIFVFWLMYASIDPLVIESALAENPAINDLNEEELKALDQVMENLPSLLPVLWVFLGLQSFSYLYYGIGVIRKHSN